MRRAKWVKFSPTDWLSTTQELRATERGIFTTLIMVMYERGKPLKNDVGRLARLCGTSSSALKKVLECLIETGKIVVTDAGLWHERVGDEFGKVELEDKMENKQ